MEASITTTADAEVVFGLIARGARWPEWGAWDSYELVRPGEGSDDGVGSVRILRTGKTTVTERIVEVVPNRRLSYVLLDGLPLRDYKASIDLESTTDGTAISWRSSFETKIPGTGWMARRRLEEVFRTALTDLVRFAEKGR